MTNYPCNGCVIFTVCSRICKKVTFRGIDLTDHVNNEKTCPDCGDNNVYARFISFNNPDKRSVISFSFTCSTCKSRLWLNINDQNVARNNMNKDKDVQFMKGCGPMTIEDLLNHVKERSWVNDRLPM
jgi:hypothetical protein